jgi:hypothetical protein
MAWDTGRWAIGLSLGETSQRNGAGDCGQCSAQQAAAMKHLFLLFRNAERPGR